MKRLFLFLFIAFLGMLSANAQGGITCPSNKTAGTNHDGVANYNSSTMVTSGLGVAPTFTDTEGRFTQRYSITGATTSNGHGSVAGIAFNKGVSTVTYTLIGTPYSISDPMTCAFDITITDNEAPKFTAQASTTKAQDNRCDYDPTIFPSPVAYDNVDANPDITVNLLNEAITAYTSSACTSKPVTTKYLKMLVRTWKATDKSGNTATTTQTVYLRDQTAPIANVQAKTYTGVTTTSTRAASEFNNGSYDAGNCNNSALTYTICRGAGCTNFSANLQLTSALASTGAGTTYPVRVQVKDYCGNVSIAETTVTMIR